MDTATSPALDPQEGGGPNVQGSPTSELPEAAARGPRRDIAQSEKGTTSGAPDGIIALLSHHFTLTNACAPGGPPSDEDYAQVGTSRRLAAQKLAAAGLHRVIDDVMLIVSELVTNAILHSGCSAVSLAVCLQAERLRITVDDGTVGHAPSRCRPVNDYATHGRGLRLVAGAAREWGGCWGTAADGTLTWCELDMGAGDR